MKPYLLAILIIVGLALGAQAADESPFLRNDAGWDCNVICSQSIQLENFDTLQS
ncbi:MAG: hypothetical protein JHC76_07750 [Akkermansiaceae bacterium]|nr:hypothetical protein [Akkermansiaceae bacterium]